MIRRALTSAFRALSRPASLAGITLFVAALALTNALIGKPRTIELALASLGISVLRWALLIGMQAVALGMVKGETDASSRVWVPPGKLLKLALVSIGGGIAAAVIVFVAATTWLALKPFQPAGIVVMALIAVAALYVMLVTSQYVLLILDDDGVDAIEAVALSIDLTKGHRLELSGLIAGMVVLGSSLLIGVLFAAHGLDLSTRQSILTGLTAFAAPMAACVNAAVYVELLRDQDARLEGIATDLTGARTGSFPSSI